MKKITIIVAALLMGVTASAQVDKKIENWYNGAKYGMSTDLAYAKLLAGKTSTPVIVAVIDSGVDVAHPDLQGHIWVNTDEIPNNGIDDDNNGFIDDINGWNFLGNSKGENLHDVRLEMTRLYATLRAQYEGKSYTDLKEDEKAGYATYKEVREKVEVTRKTAQAELESSKELTKIMENANTKLRNHFGGDYTLSQLKAARKDPKIGEEAKQMYRFAGFGLDYDSYKEYIKYYEDQLNFNYNPDIDPRADLIGDDITDFSDHNYGNNDVKGPDASHGTHCSGIIAALRNNGIGNDGVADNVLIMSVRAVPNGDEWDKDIANSVRYAVDNGAQIINMSFGKGYSPQSEGVMAAFRYAEEKGVLVVHAAGNEGENNDDLGHNFPTPMYPTMSSKFTNWIEVGASTRFEKPKYKKGYLVRNGLAADFSNYGKTIVDVYAPGHDIYSTTPENGYDVFDGTSMAGPMVSGVAALLKSYYPNLSVFEIRDIIVSTVQKPGSQTTPLPGDASQLVTFNELCVSAGIVNVYNAVILAEERSKGK